MSVTATAAPTVTSAPISTTVTSTTVASTTATHTTATRTITTTSTTTSLSGTLTLTTTTSTTSATATNGDTTGDPTSSKGLVVGGAVIGGLVFVIGAAIVAFRCTLNRRDRQRRNKEMAATLAENFDRSADPIGTPRKGYLELSDGPPTPASGHVGANLSRQGSQDAYFGAHKEGSVVGGGAQNEYYNPHYIQERYGTAHASNYGMYEETELSVINGNGGRPTTPYDHSMAYPPASVPSSHYAGYNDYGGHHDGGYYGGGGGGGGQPPRGPQGY
ncbi:hypothetical protein EDD11_006845 [Mortierella claussenii]|nr:hypothetical protein EDD11_006845 [Mortierella claussenii]